VLDLIIRKSIQGLLMMLIVSAVTFALLSAAGGDALTSLRDNPQVSEETIAELRRVYGLDRPLPVRFGVWLGGVVRGDLGESMSLRVSVASLIAAKFLNTAYLAVAAILIALFIAVILSYLSVRLRSRTLDAAIEAIVLVTAATPRIVLALIVLLISALLAGAGTRITSGSWASFALAAAVMAAPLVAVFLAQAVEQLRDAMKEDFVSLARAKGLRERTLVVRHASRAALNPLLTLLGLSFGGLLGGSVIVETILGWPGLGALTVTAVRGRDVPLVMGIVLVSSLAVWLGNTAAEFLQVVNDKRLRS
jgi:peptide/nickel transport system permease protein